MDFFLYTLLSLYVHKIANWMQVLQLSYFYRDQYVFHHKYFFIFSFQSYFSAEESHVLMYNLVHYKPVKRALTYFDPFSLSEAKP